MGGADELQRQIDALVAQGLLDAAEIDRLHAAADVHDLADAEHEAQRDAMRDEIDELHAQVEQDAEEIDHLGAAVQSRDLLGQAKGIIMNATGCGPDDAWSILVAQSQAQNRKVGEIARELITRSRHRPSR